MKKSDQNPASENSVVDAPVKKQRRRKAAALAAEVADIKAKAPEAVVEPVAPTEVKAKKSSKRRKAAGTEKAETAPVEAVAMLPEKAAAEVAVAKE
ncbi:MAG: hypothetical protein IKI30_08890, partial [Oxalobacter sp.]|nr:hypothetical protein [Oxalobacter sp.]